MSNLVRASFVLSSLATAVILTAVGVAPVNSQARATPFPVASLFFELNDSAGDLGIHGEIDGGPLTTLEIDGSNDRMLLSLVSKGRLRTQGMTQLAFESAEPPFDELAPDEFFRRFPEVRYDIEGRLLGGGTLESTVRLVSSWSINSSLAYHSGWPGTLEQLVTALDADGDPGSALRPITIYGARLPSYLRTDVRATKRWKHWQAFLELVNLTNHSNVFGYDYFRVREAGGRIGFTRNDEKWFTILPSVGVSWSMGY